MSILVIGVNHRSGPLSVLERVTIPADELPKAVERLARRDTVREVVLISTCNRTEVYAVAEKLPRRLRRHPRLPVRDRRHRRRRTASAPLLAPRRCRRHATCSRSRPGSTRRSSASPRSSARSARRGRSPRSRAARAPTMNLLFRQALVVGKRARTETGIGRGTTSVSQAAVEMAVEQLDGLDGRRVAVVGAGGDGRGHRRRACERPGPARSSSSTARPSAVTRWRNVSTARRSASITCRGAGRRPTS